jgi:hypothetical protein
MSSRTVAFADGFTSSTAPTGASGQEDYTIANNTTGGTLFTLVQATNKSAFADYELRRTSSGGTFLQTGSIMMGHDGAWTLTQGNYSGDEMLVDTISSTEHVVLSINSSTGAITYSSGNLSGTGYIGTLKLNITRVL